MLWRRRKRKSREIGLDEILIDSSNLPSFNQGRMEGRLELPIGVWNIRSIALAFFIVAVLFGAQLFRLQIVSGEAYALQSEQNRLASSVIFAERGAVYDRTGEELISSGENEKTPDFFLRNYSGRRGLAHVLGYISYPRKDSSGFYYQSEYIGTTGVEEAFGSKVGGENGERLIEVDAAGNIISEHVVHLPRPGNQLTLSIDAALSEALYDTIATTTAERKFRSGAGAIMDVRTGEIIALASYPAFDSEVMSEASNAERISEYQNDSRLPFLNKVISGMYTPGSVIKPFVALAALAEGVIDPRREIVSTGRLVIPNPYNPDNPSVFTDWRAHGAVDMRRALAVSSNIYFYHISGGYEDQRGVGIGKLYGHFSKFGLGEKTGIPLLGEVEGVIPNPEWKEENFEDGTWRLGDTYLTAIGQFGFQTTPISMLRAYAALANGGTLIEPTLVKGEEGQKRRIDIDPEHLKIVTEGMRASVEDGTARALNRSDVAFAAKTGTAEVGAAKAFVNSWVAGYFPYESPRYAFVLLLEQGPIENLFGSSPAFSQFMNWVAANRPEYLQASDQE